MRNVRTCVVRSCSNVMIPLMNNTGVNSLCTSGLHDIIVRFHHITVIRLVLRQVFREIPFVNNILLYMKQRKY